MVMRLFRVYVYLDWSFCIAENEEAAKFITLDKCGDPHGIYDDYSDMKIVEYPLNKSMVLPSHWQSEPNNA